MTKNEIISRFYAQPSDFVLDSQRILHAAVRFSKLYPKHTDIRLFSAPGRTEIGGNHTDHNQGRVLAAAVDLDAIAAAAKRDDGEIHIYSEGFGQINVTINDLQPDEAQFGSPHALVRGVAAALVQHGYLCGGFDAYIESRVLPGSGLSSSAALEVLLCEIQNALYNHNSLDAIVMAQIAQEAENRFFGKPCGLMDQTACAVGGFVSIDFSDPAAPLVRPVDFDFSHSGYTVILTDTHASHADLTGEYAKIRVEMQHAAHFFGREVLRGLDMETLLDALPALRASVGDRAALRAMHFIAEDIRAGQEAAALESGDVEAFLSLVRESGASSWQLLQNISVPGAADQSLALALAVSGQVLGGQGACRVHGGGFAGTIQAFVPEGLRDAYITRLDRIFGAGSAHCVRIRQFGAIEIQ